MPQESQRSNLHQKTQPRRASSGQARSTATNTFASKSARVQKTLLETHLGSEGRGFGERVGALRAGESGGLQEGLGKMRLHELFGGCFADDQLGQFC